jgi:predicted DNA-binding WGR domain protein
VTTQISSRTRDGRQSFQEFDSDTDADQALQNLLNEQRASGHLVSKHRGMRADTYTITDNKGVELMQLECRRT